jgi:hypothetical protein
MNSHFGLFKQSVEFTPNGANLEKFELGFRTANRHARIQLFYLPGACIP